jgi:hypothetical protein
MFERFTDRARLVLVLAQEEAKRLGHNFIGTEHILLGLMAQGEGIVADTLGPYPFTRAEVAAKVQAAIGSSQGPTVGSPPFTIRAKKVIELALRESLQLGHSYIGAEHLLLGLIRQGEGLACQILHELGVNLAALRGRVIHRIKAPEAKLLRTLGQRMDMVSTTTSWQAVCDLGDFVVKEHRLLIKALRPQVGNLPQPMLARELLQALEMIEVAAMSDAEWPSVKGLIDLATMAGRQGDAFQQLLAELATLEESSKPSTT